MSLSFGYKRRVAALDLGSNTSILLVADVMPDGQIQVLEDSTRVTRMGQGMDQSRAFHPEALTRMDHSLQYFRERLDQLQPDIVLGVATSAARDARNQEDFFELCLRHQIPVQVISGETEARLTFVGATLEHLGQSCFVIDIGGGSTEYIIGQASEPYINMRCSSLNIGSVRLTDRHVSSHPILDEEIKRMRQDIAAGLVSVSFAQSLEVDVAVAVAGTPTALACLSQGLQFNEDHVQGFILSRARVSEWVNKLACMSIAEREGLAGMPPQRAEVIVAGALILGESMNHFHLDHVFVSTKGVRYGLAYALAMGWRIE